MRDAHRMKEKFDLSLDNRQIVSLLIGGIVVLGAVFVLGVVVGKKLASNQTTAQAPDLLTALDQKAEVPLTFQEELTKKTPQGAPPPPVTAPAPVAVARGDAPRPEPVKAEPAPKPETVAATAPAPEEIEPAKPGSRPAEVAAASDSEAHDSKPESKGKVEEDAVATRTATKDGGLKDAFARVTRPTEAKTGGAWTLQISASQSKDEADRFVARLRDRGYAPYVVKAEVPGRGTWYRVRMGSFPTKEAAARYLQDFKRETQMDAFVAANN